jgi:DeoR/GlpR family transcriptional regulator of sugar metabolism
MENSSARCRTATERRAAILSAVRAEGFLSVAQLSRMVVVSHMTIRRDLQRLEQDGQVRTVYGGACLSVPALHDAGRWIGPGAADEVGIGRRAAALVGPTDTIAVDAGRLGYEVARALPEDFRGTVVTHSVPAIQLLMRRPRPPRVVGLGGELATRISAFVGAGTVAAAQGVRVGLFFLAADALDHRGAYARSDAEASVKRALLAVAGRGVVLAGPDCFTDTAPLMLGPLARFHALVTGERPPSRVERVLHGAGVDLLLADERGPAAPAWEPPGRVAPVSPADVPARVAGVRSSPVSMIGRPA